jgi:hypothetical protein
LLAVVPGLQLQLQQQQRRRMLLRQQAAQSALQDPFTQSPLLQQPQHHKCLRLQAALMTLTTSLEISAMQMRLVILARPRRRRPRRHLGPQLLHLRPHH